jgi:hypothetical protein
VSVRGLNQNTMEKIQTLAEQELVKYDEIAQQIKQQLPNVDDYVINGVWDENGYEAAKRAYRDTRKLANAIDNRRKEIKAPILEAGRAVDARAKELYEICKPVEDELSRRIASVDMEREAIKRAKRKQREADLLGAGYEYSVGAYRIGDQVVVAEAIDEASNDEWQGIIERGKAAAERVREEREKQRKEREELEELRREKAKLELEIAAAKEPVVSAPEPEPEPKPQPQPQPQPEPQIDPYASGFDACRTLCIEIVKVTSSRRDIIAEIENLQAK